MNRMEPGRVAVSRRGFLAAAVSTAAASLAGRPLAATPGVQTTQDSLTGRGSSGTLRDPAAVGRPRLPTDVRDDAAIQAIEQRLACSCGCTLDVFTCRTTDFTCTYSPELHREVLALRDGGKTAQEILDTFVAKYGEKALMAPKPEGFNLAGYLLPGTLIVAAGAALVLFIGRRKAAVAAPSGSVASPPAPDVRAGTEEMERLRRALAELED